MQYTVMISQVLHALETLQVGVGLSGLYAKAECKLTDKRNRKADYISFFACHNRHCKYVLAAKIRFSEQNSKYI